MRQAGGSIESYYNSLQGLWREIDFRRPNPMVCTGDIQKWNSLLQEDRVYIFLDGLDDRLDKIRSDVLRLQPFPTIEQAYAYVPKEDNRQAVMLAGTETTPGAVLASKGIKVGQPPVLQINKSGSIPSNGGKANASTKTKGTEGGGSGCTYCGNPKHTRETCFKLHGYPE
ncbi:UBN2_3 domain-containing protein [Quillaja saponaria]|uniref:UBN2_3 domain-containing protein n=1 Tax=Quillaja saponaria TaxID=32244 RepID=A0AAD7PYM0_QUISA|nr:UBN2_3 domain-containing protein [Quillaja saponaria]